MEKELKVCFLGARQAGIIGLLTLLARNLDVLACVSYSEDLKRVVDFLKIPVCESKDDSCFSEQLKNSDLLVCVHGREIIQKELLNLPKRGAINLHPYLYKYKGANPVQRALEEGNYKASVGAHIMQEEVDQGEVLVEEFVNVEGSKTVEEVYNKLHPYYCEVLLKALDKVENDVK
jgi:methionyl-tRNA formyltransferase